MSKGTVKWFNTKKGYGFIQPESGEKDIFVHITQLEKAGIRRLFEFYSPDYRSVVRERSSEMRAVSCIKKTPAHGREFNEEREAATAP